MSQKWPIFIWAGGQCDWLKQSNSGVLGTTRPVILWLDLHLHYKELISEFGPQPQDGSEVEVCSGLQQQHEQEHGGAQLPPEEGLRHQVLRHWTNDQGFVIEPKLRFPGKLLLIFIQSSFKSQQIPGESERKPNTYPFGTTYDHIFADLTSKDKELYTKNGMLHIMERNRRIKVHTTHSGTHWKLWYTQHTYSLIDAFLHVQVHTASFIARWKREQL